MAINSKYIIAVIEKSKAPQHEEVSLSQIDWSNLQTRTLEEKFSVPVHRYTEKNDPISQSKINVFQKLDGMYKYSCDSLPGLVVALLFGKSQTRVYSDFGIMKMAIETYNTIFTV